MKKKNDKIFKDNGGYNKRPFNWLDNPYIARKSSYKEIADYIFKQACFKETTFDMYGLEIKVQAGDYITSYRELAEATGYSLKVVWNCLKKMIAGDMIEITSGRGGTIITIIGYLQWQKQKGKKEIKMEYATQQKIIDKRNKKETPIKEQLTTTKPIYKKEVSCNDFKSFLQNENQRAGLSKFKKMLFELKTKYKKNIIMAKNYKKATQDEIIEFNVFEKINKLTPEQIETLMRNVNVVLDERDYEQIHEPLMIPLTSEALDQIVKNEEAKKEREKLLKDFQEQEAKSKEAFESLKAEGNLKAVEDRITELVQSAECEDFGIRKGIATTEKDKGKEAQYRQEKLQSIKEDPIWKDIMIEKVEGTEAVIMTRNMETWYKIGSDNNLKKMVDKILYKACMEVLKQPIFKFEYKTLR